MRLRVMRHRAGLLQRQLADRVGMDRGTYWNRENLCGVHRLSLPELYALTHACGITIAQFLSLTPTIAECVSLDLDEEFWPPEHRMT